MTDTEIINNLTTFHTQRLMGLLQRCRQNGGLYLVESHQFLVTSSLLKTVLATRPHIPNKQERAEKRKAAQLSKQYR